MTAPKRMQYAYVAHTLTNFWLMHQIWQQSLIFTKIIKSQQKKLIFKMVYVYRRLAKFQSVVNDRLCGLYLS